jgi:hypothetical protein
VAGLALVAAGMFCAPTAWAQQLTGKVTATKLPQGESAAPAVRSGIERGTQITTSREAGLAARLTARAGAARVEVALYLQGNTVLEMLPAGGLPLSPIAVQRGTLALQYAAQGEAPDLVLALRQPESWVRIRRGSMVWVEAAGTATTVRLVDGSATMFQGGLPTGDPANAQGGQELKVQPELFAAVLELINDLALAGAHAEADNWVKSVSEGPLVPPRASAPAPRGAPSVVAVAVVTPRSAIQNVTPQVLAGTAVAPTLTQAQALLASQSPASVVVGARLERTRIVGNSGTTGTGGVVRFNPQVRAPLRLGQTLP